MLWAMNDKYALLYKGTIFIAQLRIDGILCNELRKWVFHFDLLWSRHQNMNMCYRPNHKQIIVCLLCVGLICVDHSQFTPVLLTFENILIPGWEVVYTMRPTHCFCRKITKSVKESEGSALPAKLWFHF